MSTDIHQAFEKSLGSFVRLQKKPDPKLAMRFAQLWRPMVEQLQRVIPEDLAALGELAAVIRGAEQGPTGDVAGGVAAVFARRSAQMTADRAAVRALSKMKFPATPYETAERELGLAIKQYFVTHALAGNTWLVARKLEDAALGKNGAPMLDISAFEGEHVHDVLKGRDNVFSYAEAFVAQLESAMNLGQPPTTAISLASMMFDTLRSHKESRGAAIDAALETLKARVH